LELISDGSLIQPRGRNILGVGDFSVIDQKWFFTLSYANGPGYSTHTDSNGGRIDPRGMRYTNPMFRYPTTAPQNIESHSGEDVGVYAVGPHSHVGFN
jgi:alkaline phosphatase